MQNIDIYIVKPGDSLYSIAKKYNTNWKTLMDVNQLSSNMLYIGQQIIVPGNSKELKYYVQKNDTLSSIARKFNTTIDNIQYLNDLNNDEIKIGQLLVIKK